MGGGAIGKGAAKCDGRLTPRSGGRSGGRGPSGAAGFADFAEGGTWGG